MSKAYGFGGHVALGAETSGGTPVAVTDYIAAFSENFAENFDRIDTINIAGRLSEPDDLIGLGRVQGQVVVPANAHNVGHFLKGVFGVQSTSLVASGSGLWQHIYTPAGIGQEFGAKFELQPYTFEIFRDAGSAQQYTGVQMSSIQFNIAPNQDLRCTMDMIGVGETDIAYTSPTFPTSPSDPFAFDTASISIGGTANADIESFTITFDNQLEGIGGLVNSSNISKIRRTGFQLCRIQGDIAFENITEAIAYRAQTERRYVLSVTRTASFQMIFDLPRVVLDGYPKAISGRNRVVVPFTGRARYHQGSGNAIRVMLTTTQSYF
jgi:hypothetical protein